jgi:DNA repair exonuclease SbcCD ATPase subunit
MENTTTRTCPTCQQELSDEAAARLAEAQARHAERSKAGLAAFDERMKRVTAEREKAAAGG